METKKDYQEAQKNVEDVARWKGDMSAMSVGVQKLQQENVRLIEERGKQNKTKTKTKQIK